MTRPIQEPTAPNQRYVTVERLAEIEEGVRRNGTLIRQMQGGGGGGGGGVNEDTFYNGGTTTSKSFSTAPLGSWISLPIPPPAALKPIGAFTRNADGSVTVRDAGLYDIDVSIISPTAWPTATVRMVCGIGVGATPPLAGSSVARADDTVSSANAFPSVTLAGTADLPAGAVLWVSFFAVGSAGAGQIERFQIHRVGAGAKGEKGDVGATGPAGAQGPQGAKGDTGAQGATGATGSQGPQGIKGDTGAQGSQGPQGVPGAKGDTGDTGAQGAQGVPGTPGEKWYAGAGAPAGSLGIVGDWYLDHANGDVYEKFNVSSWAWRDNLTGPQGATGATGAQGPPGAGAADATTTSKGSIKLANDLAGTADLPIVKSAQGNFSAKQQVFIGPTGGAYLNEDASVPGKLHLGNVVHVDGVLEIGADTNLYRPAGSPNLLKTDDNFEAAIIRSLGELHSSYALVLGNDTALYREAAYQLRTGGNVKIDGLLEATRFRGDQLVPDTRAVPTAPGDYDAIARWGFKDKSAIDTPGGPSGLGSHASVLGVRGWSDDTGGKAHELAFADDGLYHRQGTEAAGWAAWAELGGGAEDYAVRFGPPAAGYTSVPQNTWTKLPFGPLVSSANQSEAFTLNADGTLTFLKDGWYALSCQIGTNVALTVGVGVQWGFWFTSNDTSPVNPGATFREERPHPNTGGSWIGSYANAGLYFPAGYRLGISVYNRDPTARTFIISTASVVRVGAGPQGPQGPAGPSSPNIVTSTLPSSPVDGQEVYYRNPNAPWSLWHLRYATWGDGYGWEFLGGASLTAANETNGSVTSTSHADPATGGAGPYITAPLAGLYEISVSALLQPPSVIGGVVMCALKFGAAAAIDADRLFQVTTPVAAGTVAGGASQMVKEVAAGAPIGPQFRVSSGTGLVFNRRMSIRPMRVI